jgi:hypothetical protein
MMRPTSLSILALLLVPAASAIAQPTPTPTQPRPSPPPMDAARIDDAGVSTLAASLRAGYQIRASVQTVEANPLIFIQKDSSARVCRAPMPREGTITPRYAADFGAYRCSEIK